MRRGSVLAACLVCIGAVASCSLFVSLDGLSDADAGAPDSGGDACATCNDGATGDSAPPQEAGTDASVDAGINPCTTSSGGTAGPRMIQADGYCIDSTEVTNAQYMQFVADGGAGVTNTGVCAWNVSFAPDTHGTGDSRCTAANSDPTFRPDNPITCVNWCDALAYCEWAGKRLCGGIGGGSVPFDSFTTDAQWFLACATPKNDTYPNDSNDGGKCILGQTGSIVVGASGCNGGYPGLSDMVGNVEEWTDSCDLAGEAADGGGPSTDHCRDQGDEWYENYQGVGCGNNDYDNRNETWAGIGFRCCSK